MGELQSNESLKGNESLKANESLQTNESLQANQYLDVAIEVKNLRVGFSQKQVLHSISWSIRKGCITTLLGPNGCGKSTLLKCIMGTTKVAQGEICIEGQPLKRYTAKSLAKKVAFLPQSPEVPNDMVVEELVYCGRFPHQNWWRNTAKEDREAVEAALKATKTFHLKDQLISSLSGGERQRVWIAMALAQESDILLLDEPTTYLDINHQLEVLELLTRLNKEQGLTVIMVLHELNQAAAYSHEVGVLFNGDLVAVGTPKEVFTSKLLEDVFGVKSEIETNEQGRPYIKFKGLLK